MLCNELLSFAMTLQKEFSAQSEPSRTQNIALSEPQTAIGKTAVISSIRPGGMPCRKAAAGIRLVPSEDGGIVTSKVWHRHPVTYQALPQPSASCAISRDARVSLSAALRQQNSKIAPLITLVVFFSS